MANDFNFMAVAVARKIERGGPILDDIAQTITIDKNSMDFTNLKIVLGYFITTEREGKELGLELHKKNIASHSFDLVESFKNIKITKGWTGCVMDLFRIEMPLDAGYGIYRFDLWDPDGVFDKPGTLLANYSLDIRKLSLPKDDEGFEDHK